MSELKRITYVDDEPDIRFIVTGVLEKLGGFEVQACASGGEAVEVAPGFAPDLILLDMMMPGMDGIETFKQLRLNEALSKTPVVFVTAKAQDHEVECYLELGAADVVVKPFKTLELPSRLESIWKKASAGDQA